MCVEDIGECTNCVYLCVIGLVARFKKSCRPLQGQHSLVLLLFFFLIISPIQVPITFRRGWLCSRSYSFLYLSYYVCVRCLSLSRSLSGFHLSSLCLPDPAGCHLLNDALYPLPPVPLCSAQVFIGLCLMPLNSLHFLGDNYMPLSEMLNSMINGTLRTNEITLLFFLQSIACRVVCGDGFV